MHTKISDFEITDLRECYGFYVQSDNRCLEIYELDHALFLTALGLAWKAILKNSNLKLDLLTDIEMLLMVEKGMEGGICQAVHQYAKANKKNIKDYEENKEWSYCEY